MKSTQTVRLSSPSLVGMKPRWFDEDETTALGAVFDSLLFELASRGLINKFDGHLVVLDLSRGLFEDSAAWYNYTIERLLTETTLYDDLVGRNVLFERSFGDPAKWGNEYDTIARAKALLAARTEMDTRTVISDFPQLLLPGDIRYAGGIHRQGGFCFGFSGVEPDMDHALAHTFAELLLGRMRVNARYHSSEEHFF